LELQASDLKGFKVEKGDYENGSVFTM